MADKIEDYKYPNIQPTDYIDESLDWILQRDDAAKHNFRRVSTFPSVTSNDLGMEVYVVGQGKFRLIATEPEVAWFQLDRDNQTTATTEYVDKNFQPINANLTSLASLNSEQPAVVYFAGSKNLQATPISALVMGLLNLANLDDLRNYLELGDAALLDIPIDGSYIKDGTLDPSKISSSFKETLGWSTGDVKMTFKQVADSGWVMMNDGSIGSPTSGATTRANNDTKALYSLLWNIPSVTLQSYVGTSASKTNVESDWAANKRLILPKALGRVMAGAGTGEGLSTRNLGASVGDETFSLSADSMPPHNHNLCSFRSVIGAKNGVYDCLSVGNKSYSQMGFAFQRWENDQDKYTQGGLNTTNSKGSPVDNMQPTTFVNYMIKL